MKIECVTKWAAVAGVLAVLALWSNLAFHHHLLWPGRCSGLNMKVEKGEVVATQLRDDVLALTVAFPEQHITKVIVYDYCNGRVLNTVEASR